MVPQNLLVLINCKRLDNWFKLTFTLRELLRHCLECQIWINPVHYSNSLFRSDEIELISKQRKPSHAQSLLPQLSKEAPTEMSPEDAGYSSSEYSPMHNGAGGQNISEEREEEDVGEEDPTGTPLLSTSNQSHDDYYHHEEEMSSYATTNGGSYLQTSSYVPPGYIVFDNSRSRSGTGGGAEYERFNKFSVSSL